MKTASENIFDAIKEHIAQAYAAHATHFIVYQPKIAGVIQILMKDLMIATPKTGFTWLDERTETVKSRLKTMQEADQSILGFHDIRKMKPDELFTLLIS